MKKIIAATALLLSASLTRAQQLAGYEYFFDHDPGVGNAAYVAITPASDYSGNAHIGTAGLTGGLHTFCIRFKDTSGNWGTAATRQFINLSGNGRTDSIVLVEAFFGTEPGVGNGIQIPITPAAIFDGTVTVACPPGISGAQLVYVRVKNAAGLWSCYQADSTDVSLSVGEVTALTKNGITVYPVPASETLTLDFENDLNGIMSIQLYDVAGRNVMQREFRKTNPTGRMVLELNTLPTGTYSVQVRSVSPSASLGSARIVILK